MARYEDWDNDPEDELDDRRWNGQRWPHAATDDDPGRGHADRVRVNPYSMVALAAALVLIFPIAIVFGLLSFGHPRGRGIAVLALLLGIGEAAVAAAVAMVVFGGFDVEMPALAQTTAATTSVAVASQGAPTATRAAPVVVTPPAAADIVAEDTPCSADQAGLLGVAADGATLLCLRDGDGFTWSGPYRVAGSYYSAGTQCDPSVDKSGRTSDNYALVCEGGSWVPWIE
ncbi:hypothetical protein ACFO5K_01195 [Nocardia halotolerans]|uniref:DUF4190 domain-containing protein n=1 Tax=Nocardia halotolerans TaxID=1755878 RepID=A0ABV8V9Y1_9NOCA